MNPSLLGDLSWSSVEWVNVFKNLVKIGLNNTIGVIFMTLLKGFENLKFFEVLIKIQEEIALSLVTPLKISHWREQSLQILKYLILEGPINSNLAEKISEKICKVVRELNIERDLQFVH